MQLAMAIAAVIELPARRNAYPLLFCLLLWVPSMLFWVRCSGLVRLSFCASIQRGANAKKPKTLAPKMSPCASTTRSGDTNPPISRSKKNSPPKNTKLNSASAISDTTSDLSRCSEGCGFKTSSFYGCARGAGHYIKRTASHSSSKYAARGKPSVCCGSKCIFMRLNVRQRACGAHPRTAFSSVPTCCPSQCLQR